MLPTVSDVESPAARLVRLYPLVARYAEQQGGEDGADVAQEAAIAILLNGWRHDPTRGSEHTWVWMLVKQAVERVTRHRRQRKVSTESIDELDPIDPASLIEVDERDVRRADAAVVRASVARLPRSQRRVVKRRFGLDGRGGVRFLAEVGREFGFTRSWASKKWHAAERQLAVSLASMLTS